MSWRPGLIAIPAIPLSLHLKTRLMLRKTTGKKASAIPEANLYIRETNRSGMLGGSFFPGSLISVPITSLKLTESG